MKKFVDKEINRQIIGCLMKNPNKLAETDKYNLSLNDFSSPFEKYIFLAIYNLYKDGAENITEIDVDNYFNTNETMKSVFERNNGIEYLQDALYLCQEGNFNFYYKRLKKLNVLSDLNQLGYNTSSIYCDDLTNLKAKEINEKFEEYEINDIFSIIKKEITTLETEYQTGDASTTVRAIDGAKQLLETLKLKPEVGPALQGKIFNTVCRGARKTKFYIRSMASGVGKTRASIGDACGLAYPFRFNTETWQWEYCGTCERTLFIATEQENEEIQTLILAYLTGFNEEQILYGNYNESQKIVLEQALYIMDYYKDNLFLVRMANPSIEQLKAVVRQNWLVNNIKNVFYDYIFSSPALLNEFRDLKIREDVALGLMSTALKDLAVEMKLFIMSATQTNAKGSEETKVKDETVIRGSRAIIDKCDIACVISRVSSEEEELLMDVINRFDMSPNQVTDVYKVRRGKYNKVRIWSYMDLGTCRRKDLFITNDRNQLIEEFKPINQLINEDNITEIKVLNQLNKENNIQLENLQKELTSINTMEVAAIEKNPHDSNPFPGGLF